MLLSGNILITPVVNNPQSRPGECNSTNTLILIILVWPHLYLQLCRNTTLKQKAMMI